MHCCLVGMSNALVSRVIPLVMLMCSLSLDLILWAVLEEDSVELSPRFDF